jgi:hypothetical protein
MSNTKKPISPKKPVKPREPIKSTAKTELFSYKISLQQLLNFADKNKIDKNRVVISADYWKHIQINYRQINENYEEQMLKYKQDIENYHEELTKYLIDLEKFKNE